jgi:hypothetical protein
LSICSRTRTSPITTFPLFPDKDTSRDFAHEKNTKAPEGAVTGASTGGVIGGALGWVAGIGALAIPGVGPFIAAGPIIAALSGAAVGAAAGGIAGGLIGLGIPEIEAKRYEGKINKGNLLISVHTESSKEITRAKDIFTKSGALMSQSWWTFRLRNIFFRKPRQFQIVCVGEGLLRRRLALGKNAVFLNGEILESRTF